MSKRDYSDDFTFEPMKSKKVSDYKNKKKRRKPKREKPIWKR